MLYIRRKLSMVGGNLGGNLMTVDEIPIKNFAIE